MLFIQRSSLPCCLITLHPVIHLFVRFDSYRKRRRPSGTGRPASCQGPPGRSLSDCTVKAAPRDGRTF
eukprot:750413-Hanusia_phi.AAC.2